MIKLILSLWILLPLCAQAHSQDRLVGQSRVNIEGEEGVLTITRVDDLEEARALLEHIEPSVDETFLVMQNRKKLKHWVNSRVWPNLRWLISTKDDNGDMRIDKMGVVFLTLRTAVSSYLWIQLGDIGFIQGSISTVVQLAINWTFSFKGYGLDLINYTRHRGVQLAQKFGYELEDSKKFKNISKYTTEFGLGFFVGGFFMGVIAWENVIELFSSSDIYIDLTKYTVIGLFATGSWKVFLANQKERSFKLLGDRTGMWIYRTNGVLSAAAYPWALNGVLMGDFLLGAMGASGVLAMLKGEEMLQYLFDHGLIKGPHPQCRLLFAF